MKSSFGSDDSEEVLLVDASNAFNSLNGQFAPQNTRHLCPSLATILINTYRAPTDLFIHGNVLLSQEGTTQGDPLAMSFYALSTVPLINSFNDQNVRQV